MSQADGDRPQFSVVIPVYNTEHYLNECVDSLLSQSYRSLELILVDDGSTDRSSLICASYASADSRVRILGLPRSGAAAARNAGVAMARGKYVVFVDSDDYIEDVNFLRKIAVAAEGEPDLVLYKFRKLHEESGQLEDCKFSLPRVASRESTVGKVFLDLVRSDAFYCSPCVKAIRAEMLRNGGIQFKDGLLVEDQDWYIAVAIASETVATVDESFYVYRQRPGSTSSAAGEDSLLDSLWVLDHWDAVLRDSCVDPVLREALFSVLGRLYSNALILLSRMPRSQRTMHLCRMQRRSHLLEYDAGPRTRAVKCAYRVLGLSGTIWCLRALDRIRAGVR